MLDIIKASAGSGKTYTLAYEYIKLLLGQKGENGKYRLDKSGRERHRAILAITFTNKATAEMKQRIIKELSLLAAENAPDSGLKDKSNYTAKLVKELNCSREDLKKAANDALVQLLFDFNFFNVSTIDSFFQNVLRVFAREAELTGNYDVELDDEYVLESGVSDTLASINTVGAVGTLDASKARLSEWLGKYMKSHVADGKGFNMFNRTSTLYETLVRFVNKMYSEEFKINSEPMLKYLEDPQKIVEFEKEIASRAIKLYKEITGKSTAIIDMLADAARNYNKANIPKSDNAAKALIKVESGNFDLGATLINAYNDEKKRYKKGATPDAAFDAAYLDALEAVNLEIPKYNLYRMVRDNLYALGLLGEILKNVENYRKENDMIMLSDTNDILQRIISEEELPFIYERIGIGLKHFLIDEFQDTSRMQWQNMRPLLSESLSNDHDNLIIGDVKQSIYRFRNSDPKLLAGEVQKDFSSHCSLKGRTISTNWRSSADVVKFNNTFFKFINTRYEIMEYNGVEQIISHKDLKGYVKLVPVVKDEPDPLETMAAEMKRQLNMGYNASDIAVLVRKGNEVREVIGFMQKKIKEDPDFAGLDILSDEALIVGNSNAVKLIVSILRYIDSPEQASDGRQKTAREISRLIHRFEHFINQDNEPSEALRMAMSLEMAIKNLMPSIIDMECVSLPGIVERIIAEYVPEPARRQDVAYITAFVDEVADFCSRGAGDIHSFLKWWDKAGSSACLAFPESLDAIKVMTIHKSKGLEFKCVHIPFCDWKMLRGDETKWFKAEGIFDGFRQDIVPPLLPLKCSAGNLADTPFEEQYDVFEAEEFLDALNITYVAFTRAVDELIVCYKSKELDKRCASEPVTVGDYIDEAIDHVDQNFCNSHRSEHVGKLKDADLDLFVPFKKNTFDSAPEILEIGYRDREIVEENKEKSDVTVITPDFYDVSIKDLNLRKIKVVTDIDDPTDRGTFMHKILERVRHRKDLPVAVKRQCYRLNLTSEQTREIEELLTQALSDERVEKWFDGYERVITERTALNLAAEKVEEKHPRPDRVVWTAEGTVDVVDYKFGEQSPSSSRSQIRRYVAMLESMGYKNVRGFIWNVDSGEILQV